MTDWWLQCDDGFGWGKLFFALVIGHALADYPLQSEFMARAKNRHQAHTLIDLPAGSLWLYVLSAHALIHAGCAWLITGKALFGFAEFILHWLIDWAKTERKIGFQTDQWLHLSCKAVYATLLVW